MVICAGEILADMIGREENGLVCYERYAGGAPFNVACGLKKLGTLCGFCGSVGADYNLPLGAVEEIAECADIVHIGSLPLSEEEGRAFADALIASAHAKGKAVSFDVNYRSDIFSGEAEAAAILARYIALADIVKVSKEELPLFTGGKTAEEGLRLLAGKNKIVFLTLGAAGSMACAGGEICREPSVTVRAVDMTGAGDAFFAGALAALDAGETNLRRILRQGNVCGALTAAQKGAYPLWHGEDIRENL